MRHFFRFCFALLALWFGYVAVRAIYRAVRRGMGLPVPEPSEEESLMRQAIAGALGSMIVPIVYAQLCGWTPGLGAEPGAAPVRRPYGGVALFLLTLPALFGTAILWVSGVVAIVKLYRRDPQLLLHPTVFVCCVAASFSVWMVVIVLLAIVRQGVP